MSKQHEPEKVQDEIEKNLKRAFDEIANEEVPDRFKELLTQLREAEAAKDSSDGK